MGLLSQWIADHPLSLLEDWRFHWSKFWKHPLYYIYKNEGIRNFTLFLRLCSKGNRTIIIIRQRGWDQSIYTGIIVKSKKKKRPPINDASASETDSEVDKEKKNLADDHYDIVIEKLIYRWIMYNWIFFFVLKSPVRIPHIHHSGLND